MIIHGLSPCLDYVTHSTKTELDHIYSVEDAPEEDEKETPCKTQFSHSALIALIFLNPIKKFNLHFSSPM